MSEKQKRDKKGNYIFSPVNHRKCTDCGFEYYNYLNGCPICKGKNAKPAGPRLSPINRTPIQREVTMPICPESGINLTDQMCATRQKGKNPCCPDPENCKVRSTMKVPDESFICPFHGYYVCSYECKKKLTNGEKQCKLCLKNEADIRKKVFTNDNEDDTISDETIEERYKAFLKTLTKRSSKMKHYLIDTNEMKITEVVGSQKAAKEKVDDIVMAASSPEDLKTLGKKELTKLAENLEMTKASVSGKKDEAVVLIWEKIVETYASKKSSNRSGGPTKTSLLREAFAEKKTWTVDELCEKTGYDSRNLRTALAIMKNETRTAADKLLVTDYDKEKKSYSLSK